MRRGEIQIGRARIAAGAAALLAVGLAACGQKTIIVSRAEQSVDGVVARQTGFHPNDTSCPSGVPAKVGGSFDCKFTGPDGPYTASVRITAVHGDDVDFIVRSRPSGAGG